MKSEVEAEKITKKEDPEEIGKWIGKELGKANDKVKQLQEWQDTITRGREEKQRQQKEQLVHERELYETKMKLKSELKLSSKTDESKDEIQA